MATFNRAGYLDRSIGSFLNQTFNYAELIVVDDGSDDNTFEVVNNFIKRTPLIRYLKHSNRKLSLSRNAGIVASAGKYVAFLDSDDEYKPDYLEKRFQFMESHPELDMIEGGIIVVGDPFVRDKHNSGKSIHLSECHIGGTFFGKRNVFTELGGFDKEITYSEDSAFWEKAEKIFHVKKFDHPGYIYYRNTPGSICNTDPE